MTEEKLNVLFDMVEYIFHESTLGCMNGQETKINRALKELKQNNNPKNLKV